MPIPSDFCRGRSASHAGKIASVRGRIDFPRSELDLLAPWSASRGARVDLLRARSAPVAARSDPRRARFVLAGDECESVATRCRSRGE